MVWWSDEWPGESAWRWENTDELGFHEHITAKKIITFKFTF